MKTEKRASQRLVFPKEQKIEATLVPVNGDDALVARVLNVGLGGLGLVIHKNENSQLQEEVDLFCQDVQGETGLQCLKGKTVRVKWILDYEQLENLGFGCEFVDVSDDCLQQISILCEDIRKKAYSG